MRFFKKSEKGKKIYGSLNQDCKNIIDLLAGDLPNDYLGDRDYSWKVLFAKILWFDVDKIKREFDIMKDAVEIFAGILGDENQQQDSILIKLLYKKFR